MTEPSPDKQCFRAEDLGILRVKVKALEEQLKQAQDVCQTLEKELQVIRSDNSVRSVVHEERMRQISELLSTNIQHIGTLVQTLHDFDKRLIDTERFQLKHTMEYLNMTKELSTIQSSLGGVVKFINRHSRHHWKLGVIIAVVGTIILSTIKISNIKDIFEFISHLFK